MIADTVRLERAERFREEYIPQIKNREYTTGEVVFGLLAGGTLLGSLYGNHHLMDFREPVNPMNMAVLGAEMAAYLGFGFGYAMSKAKRLNEEARKKVQNIKINGLESKVSLN